jgi:hypothetical protein
MRLAQLKPEPAAAAVALLKLPHSVADPVWQQWTVAQWTVAQLEAVQIEATRQPDVLLPALAVALVFSRPQCRYSPMPQAKIPPIPRSTPCSFARPQCFQSE